MLVQSVFLVSLCVFQQALAAADAVKTNPYPASQPAILASAPPSTPVSSGSGEDSSPTPSITSGTPPPAACHCPDTKTEKDSSAPPPITPPVTSGEKTPSAPPTPPEGNTTSTPEPETPASMAPGQFLGSASLASSLFIAACAVLL